MIPNSDRWGPWRDGLDAAELRARLRSLRALARVLLGPRGDSLADALHRAEDDPAALVPALAALDQLAPLDRRRLLGSYAPLL